MEKKRKFVGYKLNQQGGHTNVVFSLDGEMHEIPDAPLAAPIITRSVRSSPRFMEPKIKPPEPPVPGFNIAKVLFGK